MEKQKIKFNPYFGDGFEKCQACGEVVRMIDVETGECEDCFMEAMKNKHVSD